MSAPRPLEQLAAAVAADPAHPEWEALARALVRRGAYRQAIDVCRKGLAARPSAGGRLVLAEALVLTGEVAEAEAQVAGAAAAGEAPNPLALRLLGHCRLLLGEPDEARRLLERSAAADPSDMQTLDLLASLGEPADGAPGPQGEGDWADLRLDDDPAFAFEPPDARPSGGVADAAVGAEEAHPDELPAQDPSDTDPSDPEATRPHVPPPRLPASGPAAPLSARRAGERPPRRAVGRTRLRDPRLLAAATALLLVVLGLGWARTARERATERRFAAAEAAFSRHTFGGYREAEAALASAGAAGRNDPRALAIRAFVAARRARRSPEAPEVRAAAATAVAEAERLAAVPPRALAARALLDLEEGRPADVVLAAADGLSRHPESPALRWVQALAQARLERPDLARTSLESLVADAPGFLPAVASLQALLSRQGRPEDAADLARRTALARPHAVAAATAWLAAARERPAEAEAALGHVAAHRETLWSAADASERCRLGLAEARAAAAAGHPDRARAVEDAARSEPASPACRAALGRWLAQRQRPGAALPLLASAADALAVGYPTRAARLRREAAASALTAGQPERALELLARVPLDGDGVALLGRAHLARGDAEAAATALAQGPRRGGPAALHALRAELAARAGRVREARRHGARARAAALEAGAGFTEAIAVLRAVGRTRRAADLAEAALERSPEASFGLRVEAAHALAEAGRREAALAALQSALRFNPEPAEAAALWLELVDPEAGAAFAESLPAPWGPRLKARLTEVGETPTGASSMTPNGRSG